MGKIFYLCDGEVEKCKEKKGCHKNGGECKHTSDIRNARNFKNEGRGWFRENETAPENQTQNALEEL